MLKLRAGHGAVSAVPIAILSVVVLSGCDPIYQDDAPLAVQGEEGNFRLAVCTDVVVDGVLVEERVTNASSWETIWDAAGDLPIASGSVLESADPPSALDVTSWRTIQNLAGGTVSVLLVSGELALTAEFLVPEGGLPSDAWLQADGTQTVDPCPIGDEN